MKNPQSVLISGASIAGPVLAYWLSKHGFKVTLVERASELRLSGQNIDIQGAARKIISLMGLEQLIRDASTNEIGLSFVDKNGVSQAKFPIGNTSNSRGTKELEILRGELAKIFYDQTKDDVEYIFGDFVNGLKEHDDHVTISFAVSHDRDFDLIVAADGIRSSTRDLILKDKAEIRALGIYCAYFSMPRVQKDNNWWRWYNAPNSRGIHLRPDNQGNIRASLWFISKPMSYEALSQAEQKSVLQDKFCDAGWESKRVLEALEHSTDMYFDNISQVYAASWSKGRGAIVGDCAYGPSPLTGMGTTLAIVGAYILAGELASHSDYKEAFKAYEERMRPYVKLAQKIPPGVPRLAHPKTKLGIWLLHKIAHIATNKFFKRKGNGLGNSPANQIELPHY